MLAWRHALIWNILRVVMAAMKRPVGEAQDAELNNATQPHCSDASVKCVNSLCLPTC